MKRKHEESSPEKVKKLHENDASESRNSADGKRDNQDATTSNPYQAKDDAYQQLLFQQNLKFLNLIKNQKKNYMDFVALVQGENKMKNIKQRFQMHQLKHIAEKANR